MSQKSNCKKCKYDSEPHCIMCNHPSVKPFWEEGIEYIDTQLSLNKNGECKLYKRKWWRLRGSNINSAVSSRVHY